MDRLISEQAVIDAIDKWIKDMGVLTVLPTNKVTPLFESIHDLPSVNPQEPCDDVISRQAVFEQINCWIGSGEYCYTNATDYLNKRIKALQAVNPQEPIYYPPCEDCHNKMNEIRKAYDKIQSAEPMTGHCKDCKYFEYDSVAKVDGIPLIVAHEICSRWGDGCKTSEDGYCFLFEPQEREVRK